MKNYPFRFKPAKNNDHFTIEWSHKSGPIKIVCVVRILWVHVWKRYRCFSNSFFYILLHSLVFLMFIQHVACMIVCLNSFCGCFMSLSCCCFWKKGFISQICSFFRLVWTKSVNVYLFQSLWRQTQRDVIQTLA